jgi:predicted KAP-like P-loop ATPase
MSTIPAVDKSQTVRAIERTETLLHELKQASDVVETKDAIMSYISDIDCCSDYEDNPFVLGDTDFAHLFVQSLERRGKTPLATWVPQIIHGAQVERSPEVKQVLENLHKRLKRTLGS